MAVVLPVMLAALLAGAVIVYFYQEHVRQKKLQLRVEKLYASRMFEDMLPTIHFARRHPIESLTVDKTGVVIRFLHSDNQETAFLMRANGYRYLTPEQQEAMRAVWEECVPKLCEKKSYRVFRQRVTLLNGNIEYAYQYTMSIAYKNRLMRAPYYDGSLQTHSW